MPDIVLFAIALATVLQVPQASGQSNPASPSTANFAGIIFASGDELLLCLGVPSVTISSVAPNVVGVLVDCEDYGTLWRRTVANAGFKGPLQLAFTSGCLGSGQEAAGSFGTISTAACGVNGWSWQWDEQHRLRGTSSGPSWCLLRQGKGIGAKVVLTSDCTSTSGKEWLPLPRGAGSEPYAGLGNIQFPLQSHGRRVIDSAGRVIRLRSLNWYGAHMEQRVNNGLSKQPLATIARMIRHLGFNSIRMNYAVQMWVEGANAMAVNPMFLTANPDLVGKSPLLVFDAVVTALTQAGLMVIINSHTSDYRWCCGLDDEQGLWYNSRWSEMDWLNSLAGLAARYSGNPRVIGYDLRNEPRPSMPDPRETSDLVRGNPTLIWWDTTVGGNCFDASLHLVGMPDISLGFMANNGLCLQQFAADWRLAATQGSYAVWKGNPTALVFVEGVAAADLVMPMQSPMPFVQSCLKQRIVWSVHDYEWMWQWFEMTQLMSANGSYTKIFQQLSSIYMNQPEPNPSWNKFVADRDRAWAYLLTTNVAPVWIGEIGTGGNGTFWQTWVKYARQMDLDWSYWSIDGIKYPKGQVVNGSYMDMGQRINSDGTADVTESWGLLGADYMSSAGGGDVWRLVDLTSLQAAVPGEQIVASATAAAFSQTCVFDPRAQPVVGTGPHPLGLAIYGTSASTCTGRRVQSKVAVQAPVPVPQPTQDEAMDKQSQHLASLASSASFSACNSGVNSLNAMEINDARQALQNVALNPNPIDAILRQARSPKEAQSQLGSILAEQVGSMSNIGSAIGIAVAVIVVFVAGLFVYSWKTKTSRWLTPMDLVSQTLGIFKGCCPSNEQEEIATVNLEKAFSAMKSWRYLLAATYVILFFTILGACIWGLVGRARVQNGISMTSCASLQGVNILLNGGDQFAGLQPGLAAIDVAWNSLSHDSNFWTTASDLVQQLQRVPRGVVSLGTALGALTEAASAACPGLDLAAVQAATSAMKRSIAATVAVFMAELQNLLPDGGGLLTQWQGKLAQADGVVRSARDVLVNQLQFIYAGDPLSLAQNYTNLALAVIIAIFLLVLPTLIWGGVAVLRFVFFECIRDFLCGLNTATDEDAEKKQEEDMASIVWFPPRSALCTWTTGFLYSAICFAIFCKLQSATSMAASVCVASDQLTITRLNSYSAALGFQTGSTASALLGSCLCETGGQTHLVAMDTCPIHGGRLEERNFSIVLGIVDAAIAQHLQDLQDVVRQTTSLSEADSFNSLRTMLGMAPVPAATSASQTCVAAASAQVIQSAMPSLKQTDPTYISLLAQLKAGWGSNPSIATAVGTAVTAMQCVGMQMSYAYSCDVNNAGIAAGNGSNYPPMCSSPAQAPTCVASPSNFGSLRQDWINVMASRTAYLDAALVNFANQAFPNLWALLKADVLQHMVQLADNLDCKFLKPAIEAVIEGACYEIVGGLIEVQRALLMLSILCFFMSAVMYILWLRITQFRTLALEQKRMRAQAEEGGIEIDTSGKSRGKAKRGPEPKTMGDVSDPSHIQLEEAPDFCWDEEEGTGSSRHRVAGPKTDQAATRPRRCWNMMCGLGSLFGGPQVVIYAR